MSTPQENNPPMKDTNEITEQNNLKRSFDDIPAFESLKKKKLPKNAQAIAILLKSFGIKDVHPNVIYQLQEFAHRYTADVLQDAMIFSEHGGKSSVDVEDVKEAIQGRIHHSFAPPPSQEFIKELASTVNSRPLPIIHEKFGVRLPKEKYCLTATNYQIIPDPASVTHKFSHLKSQPTPVQEEENDNDSVDNEETVTNDQTGEPEIKIEEGSFLDKNDENNTLAQSSDISIKKAESEIQENQAQQGTKEEEEEEEEFFEEVDDTDDVPE